MLALSIRFIYYLVELRCYAETAQSLVDPERINKMSNVDISQIFGKIKIVDNFPDYKIKVVDNFPDLKVKKVDNFPDRSRS